MPTAVEIVEFRPLFLEISHGGGEVVIGVDGRFHGVVGRVSQAAMLESSDLDDARRAPDRKDGLLRSRREAGAQRARGKNVLLRGHGAAGAQHRTAASGQMDILENRMGLSGGLNSIRSCQNVALLAQSESGEPRQRDSGLYFGSNPTTM